MSIEVMTWVFKESRATGNDRLILLAIADHADAADWSCWPSVGLLADKARVSHRTAQRSVRALVELGEIAIVEGGGSRKTHRFTVCPQGRQVVIPPVESGVTPQARAVTDRALRGDTGDTRTISEPSRTADQSADGRTLGPQEYRDPDCDACGGSGVSPFGIVCECFRKVTA